MVVTPHAMFQERVYIFKKYLGILLCYEGCLEVENHHTGDYVFVENPYLLKRRKTDMSASTPHTIVKLYAWLLVLLSRYCFPLLYIIPYIVYPIYQDAGVANKMFYQLFPEEQQKRLCLPRAVFTASLSKRFKKHGTLFIGAFLPTNHLHSWVIEDGMHADIYDKQWIQYTPVMEWQWRKE